jgi:DnaJ-domain-containing protein 1
VAELALNGRLQDEPLPLLLHQLHVGKATGTLHLNTRVGNHEVFVRDGFPVSVSLPGSAELLGKVLVEMGIIDEETHRRTLAEPPPKGMRYGEWLVEKKLVTAEHMRLALKAQVRRKLHRLFFLNEGQFKFDPGEHRQGLEGHDSLRIHPARAIYQGVRSAWNAERLAGTLFLLEGRAIKCAIDENAVARYGIGAEDGKVAELLRKGYWTLQDLIEALGMPVQPVHALVYALYVTEALDVKGAEEVPRLRRKAGETPPRGTAPPPAPAPATPPRTSSSPQVTPPRTSSSPQVTPPRTSSSPQVTRTSSSPQITPPREISGAHAMPSGATDPAAMRRQIEAKAKVVELESLFAVLGLTDVASKDQIKAAYFDAAKRYHPDRLTSLGLEALRPEVEKIFRRVSEAYGTLMDDGQREAYKKSLAKPGGSGESPEAHAKAMKMLEAEMAFRRGEILLRKNDFAGAIKELEQAVAGNPQEGEHLAWLTWARVCAAQINYAEAKPRFQEATKLSPKCARAFYFLGLALKEEKDVDRAQNAFKKAIDLDPRLLEAERELRLLNMRREKEKSSGWFKKK